MGSSRKLSDNAVKICNTKAGMDGSERPEPRHDPVHPGYYRQGELEAIDAIAIACSSLSGVDAFCAGNAVKYIMRAGKKGQAADDLIKAGNYLHRLAYGTWMGDGDGRR